MKKIRELKSYGRDLSHNKILLTMKLSALLLGLNFLQVSACVFSQNTSFKVEETKLTLKDVINTIEKQTDYRVAYSATFVDQQTNVNLVQQENTVESFLEDVVKEMGMGYLLLDNNVIVLTNKNDKLINQENVVKGVVKDATGNPLPGVNIIEKGTNNGTVTDLDGKYSITVSSSSILVFSFIGYLSEEIEIGNQTTIDVTLVEDIQSLDEVVVVGYGVQKKSNVTGSIASVQVDELQNRSTDDVGKSLQGKVSGVQILTMSGAPGSAATFRVRGYSNNTGSDPLYIVDGLKVPDISYLDANNIASVEVLKDAASAAIYGAEAGNGVVLISTKSGASGSTRIFFNTKYINQSQANILEMLNAAEFRDYWGQAGIPEESFQNGDTDWNDVVFENGVQKTYTFGAEGGNEKGTYYTAVTYNDDNGMVVGNNDINKRITAQVNADYNIKPWLKIGTTNTIERGKIVEVSANNFTATGSVIGGGFFYDPTVPLYYASDADVPAALEMLDAEENGYKISRNSEGQVYGSSLIMQSNLWHPLGMIENYKNERWRTNVNGTAYAELKPVKGLVFTSRLGYRLGNEYESHYTDSYWWNRNQNQLNGSLNAELTHRVYIQWENFANYLLTVGKNDISAMAGMNYSNLNATNLYASTSRLQNDAENYRYIEYSAADATDDISGENIDSRNISYFGRLSYTFDSKYMLQGTFRADAYDNSKLSSENRWGYFPAVSAGWVVSNESFMQNSGLSQLSYLKLRASWGVNGNVNVLENYPWTSSLALGADGSDYYSFTNSLITGASPSDRLANPDLTWEKSIQTDIGFDARFFDNRLSFGMDYFKKVTDGLLGEAPAPVISGTNSVLKNIGKIENSGLEFDLGWKDQIGDFSYSINGNLSTLHNEVIESPYGDGRAQGGGAFLTNVTYFEKGHPIWYLRTYIVDHIDETTGQPIYKTAAELGTDDGRAPVGSSIPDITYGFTVTADYKNFDVRVFGTGVSGNELLFGVVRTDLPRANLPKFLIEDHWSATNTDGTKPSPLAFAQGAGQYAQSDHLIFDASYFKIKEIQLGYMLPTELTSKIKISSLRIYASLENFFTFTNYPGIDPESMGGTSSGEAVTLPNGTELRLGGGMGVDRLQYPSMKQVVFGVNVSF